MRWVALISTVVLMFSFPARGDELQSVTSSTSDFPYRTAAIAWRQGALTCQANLDACREHRSACLDIVDTPTCDECRTPGWVYPVAAISLILAFAGGFIAASQ